MARQYETAWQAIPRRPGPTTHLMHALIGSTADFLSGARPAQTLDLPGLGLHRESLRSRRWGWTTIIGKWPMIV